MTSFIEYKYISQKNKEELYLAAMNHLDIYLPELVLPTESPGSDQSQ